MFVAKPINMWLQFRHRQNIATGETAMTTEKLIQAVKKMHASYADRALLISRIKAGDPNAIFAAKGLALRQGK